MIVREVQHLVRGQRVSDGDGVMLTRVIGTPEFDMLDPFLLLDVFESDRPEDYLGGFPSHPHRGFETVTYLLAGNMRHKDSVGNEGVIKPGGVQWMTAAKGIVHSEMPEQVDGLLKGFQLWVNLPASEKMSEPKYQEFPADEVALEQWKSGSTVRVISGQTNKGTTGPVENRFVNPTYLDVQLKAFDSFEQDVTVSESVFVYQIDGRVVIGNEESLLESGVLAVLNEGDQIKISARTDRRFLVVAAKPLNEPVARGGPFVMNTRAQLMKAFEDFRTGNF